MCVFCLYLFNEKLILCLWEYILIDEMEWVIVEVDIDKMIDFGGLI